MADNFYMLLAFILLIPIIPAYIIYKFLPESSTDVSGPYTGLSLKLKGAFAGYFLLVIVGVGLQYALMSNNQQKLIEALNRTVSSNDSTIARLNAQLSGAVTDWVIKGLVSPAGKKDTRFFYDDGTTRNEPDGSFELVKRTLGKEGTAKPPKWMCVYNPATGYKVISFNRELSHPDIEAFNIAFDDVNHEIRIQKPIEINSIEKDSVKAVVNYIEKNPALKKIVIESDPMFLEKSRVIRELQLRRN